MDPKQKKIDAYKSASAKPKSSHRQKKDGSDDVVVQIGNMDKKSQPVEKPRTTSRALDSVQRPAIDEGFFKTTGKQGIRKAAKLIVILGRDRAAEIIRFLTEEEVSLVMKEVAAIKKVDRHEAELLLKEFHELAERAKQPQGGREKANELLTEAFGPHLAQKILGRVLDDAEERPFAFLNDLEYHQILSLIKGEKAMVMSVVLTFIEPELASRVFEALHPDVQKDVVQRIARMEKIHPDVLVKMEEILREKIRRQGKIVTEEIDGKNALANILKFTDAGTEEKILADLEEMNPEVSREIRERTLTIDIIEKMRRDDFQAVLRDFSDSELAVILKGKGDDVKDFFFKNLSERRRGLIKDEMKYSGPMKKSDVDQATKEFVLYIKQLEDEGKISIYRDKDQYI
ncbi:MAG: flagellar motor switch protein FliG [Spirochaetales bacterium]|nr:flagellar motor switch protein FliG [Spirochaetales bacterium]